MYKNIILAAFACFGAQFLSAQVISTDLNLFFNNNPTYMRTDLDLDSDGTVDFVIDFINQNGGAGVYLAGIGSTNNNELVCPSFWDVIVFADGDEIGPNTVGWFNPTGTQDPNGNFTQNTRLAYKFYGGGNTSGNWVNVANRYVGLRFFKNGNTYYGYVEVSCIVDPQPGFLEIIKVAYESTPGTSIIAGTTGTGIPIPPCDGDILNVSTISQDTTRAKRTLTSDAIINQVNPIHFSAFGQYVLLNDGFEVSPGSVFSADIEECQ